MAAVEDKDAEHNMHVQSRKHRTYAMVKDLIGCDLAPFPLMDDLPAGRWILHAEANGWKLSCPTPAGLVTVCRPP